MKKILVSILILPLLAITSCSPNEQEQEQDVIVDARDPSHNSTAKPTKDPNDFANGVIEMSEAELEKIKPVDNNLEIALPSIEPHNVSRNESIRLTAPGDDPDAVFESFLYYYNNGDNQATLILDEHEAEEDGSVVADIVIPKNIEPGKYVIALDAGAGTSIYSVPIVVK